MGVCNVRQKRALARRHLTAIEPPTPGQHGAHKEYTAVFEHPGHAYLQEKACSCHALMPLASQLVTAWPQGMNTVT